MAKETAIATQQTDAAIMEQVLVGGDLAKLTPAQRASYYMRVCESVGLNAMTRPFEYIVLNSKLTLYARKDCADQLRKLNGVSCWITSKDKLEDVYIVTVSAKDAQGREDASTGVVTIGNLKGDTLANALMKAETKAKRRVTLSICGLGWMDETEVETVPNTRRVQVDESGEIIKGFVDSTNAATNEQAAIVKELINAKFTDPRGKLKQVMAFVLEDQAPEHPKDMAQAQADLVIDYLRELDNYDRVP